jgi:CRISPR/Cas system CMR subunit Cmr6 (Cas7 group RAMP superfamily)
MYDYFLSLRQQVFKKQGFNNPFEHSFYQYKKLKIAQKELVFEKNFIFSLFKEKDVNRFKKYNFLGIKIIQEKFRFENIFFSKNDKLYNPDFNLISKDWVSNQPYIKSTTWKGIIRYSFYMLFHKDEDFKKYDTFLFGQSDYKENIIGSIFYFPTFFTSGDLSEHIINNITVIPNKRHPKANPIKYQVLKKGTEGTLVLVVAPIFDKSCKNIDIGEAIEKLKQAIKNLENIGIGAKTRIGWGKIKFDNLEVKDE